MKFLVFRYVGDEPEFAQDGGAAVVAQDVKSALFDAAIFGRVGLEIFALNVGGKAFRFDPIVIGFKAVSPLAACPIVMHADKDARRAAVGCVRAGAKGNKIITRACLDDFETVPAEDLGETARGVEGQVFFVGARSRASACVAAAVSGINDDRVEMAGTGAVVSTRGRASTQRDEGDSGEHFAHPLQCARAMSLFNDSIFHDFVAIAGSCDPSIGGEDRKAGRRGNHFSLDLCGMVRG